MLTITIKNGNKISLQEKLIFLTIEIHKRKKINFRFRENILLVRILLDIEIRDLRSSGSAAGRSMLVFMQCVLVIVPVLSNILDSGGREITQWRSSCPQRETYPELASIRKVYSGQINSPGDASS
eukprot:Gregarina_sp_Poly_1__3323@NODE_1956_length_3000_cov_798_001023_g1259_i0_p3_GENE_NODE_1956_length_3000_cov_798_001023_g1259_i0NODE_1956_length_3000_cov_798_001023_g1259_i0_p3_ORF_typecomplete_len125_score3_03Bac_small_YrzI/PF09501_10/31Bac_small_YrzI/PF09501_10/0_9_NODE_1956_length_3000_cov_798_001023_g1259_i0519893